ncbi:molybdenum cofactor guanylyltransferase [Sanguibacter antarcticus]|uniref:Molybdopterin-guanine dinucleotide biosynthesis protein A n=1 Tax=Sanguibacter antarcticus TaxID=372484 RepID=A0A2A9E8E8_9MICO|nr:molybdenum cofactor guanylyltransferase [Sanguibacter antarcticus]PFG34440.1 molybdopterin-guanine dinucleotide biosynthesis protein A [Sanguibacter antarcticus]
MSRPSTDSTTPAPALPVHDAIVLAGGRARRLGGDKPNVHVGGRRLLDHALEATTGARRVVVVGPEDLLPDADVAPGGRLSVVREDPPFGGPVAGLAAGLARLAEESADAVPVLLLACDVPLVPRLVRQLLSAWSDALLDAARHEVLPADGVFVESAGRAQWLVGVYDPTSLRRSLTTVASTRTIDGASMKQVVGHLALLTTQDPEGLSADVDTWLDVEHVDTRLNR